VFTPFGRYVSMRESGNAPVEPKRATRAVVVVDTSFSTVATTKPPGVADTVASCRRADDGSVMPSRTT